MPQGVYGHLPKDNHPHLHGIPLIRKIPFFKTAGSGKDDVCILCTGSHNIIYQYNHFTPAVIPENVMGMINIRVLINKCITGKTPQKFNGHFQVLFSSEPTVYICKTVWVFNGLCP
jgi:hypothetical protein